MSKRNVEAQERVVSALWTFAVAQSKLDPTKPHTTTSDGIAVSLPAVGVALDDIMDAFGFRVTPID